MLFKLTWLSSMSQIFSMNCMRSFTKPVWMIQSSAGLIQASSSHSLYLHSKQQQQQPIFKNTVFKILLLCWSSWFGFTFTHLTEAYIHSYTGNWAHGVGSALLCCLSYGKVIRVCLTWGINDYRFSCNNIQTCQTLPLETKCILRPLYIQSSEMLYVLYGN